MDDKYLNLKSNYVKLLDKYKKLQLAHSNLHDEKLELEWEINELREYEQHVFKTIMRLVAKTRLDFYKNEEKDKLAGRVYRAQMNLLNYLFLKLEVERIANKKQICSDE